MLFQIGKNENRKLSLTASFLFLFNFNRKSYGQKTIADSSVEVIAVGSESQIDALDAWLQEGPRTAIVDDVFVEDYLGEKEFTTFQVLH